MNKKLLTIIALAMLVVLAGCRSSRRAAKESNDGAATVLLPADETQPDESSRSKDKSSKKGGKKSEKDKDYVKVQPTGVDALTAKLELTLEAGGKSVDVGGSYRLQRDKVIQINLTYTMIITVAVGTMELTPDYILILDRINKRYCRIQYSDVPALQQAGIDFNYLQSIFWGEAEASPTKVISWTYSRWTDLGQGQFPGQIGFTLTSGTSIYKATFDLSNIRENDNWEKQTTVPAKYTPVSIDTVIKALMSVAK